MSESKFQITTTEGTLVFKGKGGEGLAEDEAKASTAERNARAEELGIEARYEVRPL